MKLQIIHTISLIIILLASTVVMYIGYLLFYPVHIIDLRQPLMTDKSEYAPGDTVKVTLDYCKYRRAEADVTVSFLGEVVSPLYVSPNELRVGCFVDIFPVQIPVASSSGMRKIEVTFNYRVNKIRKETYKYTTKEFMVSERSKELKELLEK